MSVMFIVHCLAVYEGVYIFVHGHVGRVSVLLDLGGILVLPSNW